MRDTILQARRWGDPGGNASVVVLHGFGADNGDLIPLAREIDPGGSLDWHFLRAPVPLTVGGASYGRAWFPDTEPELYAALTGNYFLAMADLDPEGLGSSARQVVEYCGEVLGAAARPYVGGFSQGSMVALECCLDPGFAPAGLFMLSGGLIAAERTAGAAARRSGPRFLQCHGTADTVLDYEAGRNLFDVLVEAGWQGEFIEFEDGHTVPAVVVEPLRHFLSVS